MYHSMNGKQIYLFQRILRLLLMKYLWRHLSVTRMNKNQLQMCTSKHTRLECQTYCLSNSFIQAHKHSLEIVTVDQILLDLKRSLNVNKVNVFTVFSFLKFGLNYFS